MQRFQYPYLLGLLLLILPLVGLMIWNYRWKKNTIGKFFKSPIVEKIFPYISTFNLKLRFGVFIAAIILLVIAIANPQIGTKQEKIKGQGIDIMILLDVSNSMLAQDIQPNRLERSKLFINKLLDNLKNDRVGFVIFAGNAYLQVPLTIDFTAIKMSLPIIDPTDIPSQGTNIGEAVDLAGKSLGLTDSKNKAIVIVTDGEDHDANANSAIEKARKNGIKVFAIGVGEEKGAPIPMGDDVKKDENGQPVLTAFNRKMLEELATIGNGNFYHLGQQSDIVEDVASSLSKIEGKEFEEFDFSNYNSFFYWFALFALLLLFIEFIIPDIDIKKFMKNLSIIIFLILGLNTSIYAQDSKKTDQEKKDKAKTLIRKGNSNFQNNKFQDAEYNYRKALIVNPKSKTAQFNLGNALYQQQKYQEAADQYEASINKNDDKVSRAKAYHNLGNSNFKANQLDKAIAAYENALKLNPNDMDTKYNLALAKKQQDKKGGGKNQPQPQQDKKEGDEKKDKKDGQPKEGEGEQEQEQEKEQPKNNGKNMNKDDVQRLLEALKNQEQNTQNKVQQQKGKPEQKKHEKDW
jgi:tetratricopeptide (TPR) repeat protein/uncharacterized protein YegL